MQTTSLSDNQITVSETLGRFAVHQNGVLFGDYATEQTANFIADHLRDEASVPTITLPKRCANPECSLALDHAGDCRRITRATETQWVKLTAFSELIEIDGVLMARSFVRHNGKRVMLPTEHSDDDLWFPPDSTSEAPLGYHHGSDCPCSECRDYWNN